MRIHHVELVITNDKVINNYHKNGAFEPESMKAWEAAVSNGGCAIDVGSYNGLYSIRAAQLGAAAVAFEPLPDNYNRIQENVGMNNIEIETHACAVGDKAARAFLYFSNARNTSGGSLTGSGANNRETNKVMVEVITLDQLNLENVVAIKADVEGFEPKVIQGAINLINTYKPLLILEALTDEMEYRIKAELPDFYKIRRADKRNLICEA